MALPNQTILTISSYQLKHTNNPDGSLSDNLKVEIRVELEKNYVDRVNNTLEKISTEYLNIDIDNIDGSLTVDGKKYSLEQIFAGQGETTGTRNAAGVLILPSDLVIIPLRPNILDRLLNSASQDKNGFVSKTLELWSLRYNSIRTRYENEVKKIDENDSRSNGNGKLNDVENPNPNLTNEDKAKLNEENNNNTTFEKTDVKGFGSNRLIAESLNINKDGVKTLKIGERNATITGDGFIDVDGVPVPLEDIIIIQNGVAISVLEAIKTNPDTTWFYDQIVATRDIQLPPPSSDGEIDFEKLWLSTEGLFEGPSYDLKTDASATDDVNEADEGSTNGGDALDKDAAKAKSQKTPDGGPDQVEQSPAMTKRNFERIQSKVSDISPNLLAQNQRQTGKIGKPGWWAFRRYPDNTPYGKPEYEFSGVVSPGQSCTIDGKIGSVQYHFKGDLMTLRKNTGRGVNVITGKENVVDFPIWMNFPEVGLWNKLVPYIADNQTEQHMGMIPAGRTYFHNLPGGYGIGLYSNVELGKPDEANWGIAPPWCGITTNAVIRHGGYMHYHGSVIGAADGAADWWKKSSENYRKNNTEEKVGFSKWGMFASIPISIENAENIPIKSFFKTDKNGNDFWSKTSHQSTDAYLDKPITEKYTEMVERRKTIYEQDPVNPKKRIKKVIITQEPVVKTRSIPQIHYEQLLPNPTGIMFLRGVHYDLENGITKIGTRLLDHLFNQNGWEIGVITRNSHVETILYLNPDLTGVNIGGNTGSKYSKFLHQGNHMAVKKFDVKWPGQSNFFVITKTVSTWGSQKVESNLNGKFRRTPIVNSYYSLIGKEPNIFSDLKLMYDRILD